MDKNFSEIWAKYCFTNVDMLKYFLYIANVAPKYTVNNQLYIMSYCQERAPVQLKGIMEWEAMGAHISANAMPIYIYEPVKDENGRITGYNHKQMVDVLDTDYQYQKIENSAEQALEALLVNEIVPIEVINGSQSMNERAQYEPAENKIYVVRSGTVSADEFFCSIAKEMAHAVCHSNIKDKTMSYNRAMHDLDCRIIAYGLAKLCNVNTQSVEIEKLPKEWLEMGESQCLNKLYKLHDMNKDLSYKLQSDLKKVIERDAKQLQPYDRERGAV